MTIPGVLEGLGWVAAGAALAGVYLYLIGRTVAALQPPAARAAAGGYLALRVALAVGAFALAAMSGAVPLLLMLAAFILVRTLVVRRVQQG